MLVLVGIVVVFRVDHRRLLDRERKSAGTGAAGRVDNHRRGGHRQRADRQSSRGNEADCRRILASVKGSPYTKATFLDTLKMLYELFSHVSKVGMQTIEGEVDAPDKSPILSKYPKFLADHHALAFVCDTIRTYSSGSMSQHQLDHLMEIDIESVEHEDQTPVSALATISDSLPGLGIVAAVLGVVVTMGSLGGPPEEVGHKVAAALVGTFLGILLCYGLVGPISSNMTKLNEGRAQYYQCIRQGLLSFSGWKLADLSCRVRAPVVAIGPSAHVQGSRRDLPKLEEGIIRVLRSGHHRQEE
jgi:flagellar motor component MotA